MAVGKWHLAGSGEYSAAGPMDHWPLGMGFEKYYGFLAASTNQCGGGPQPSAATLRGHVASGRQTATAVGTAGNCEVPPWRGRVTADQLPNLAGGFMITGDIGIREGANGIVTAFGDRNGGFVVYLLDGRPVVHFVLLDSIVRMEGNRLEAGRHVVQWRCTARPGSHWGTGSSESELFVDGEPGDRRPCRRCMPSTVFLQERAFTSVGTLVCRCPTTTPRLSSSKVLFTELSSPVPEALRRTSLLKTSTWRSARPDGAPS